MRGRGALAPGIMPSPGGNIGPHPGGMLVEVSPGVWGAPPAQPPDVLPSNGPLLSWGCACFQVASTAPCCGVEGIARSQPQLQVARRSAAEGRGIIVGVIPNTPWASGRYAAGSTMPGGLCRLQASGPALPVVGFSSRR